MTTSLLAHYIPRNKVTK